ncbi:MAG: hypothetical protein U9N38_01080 [Thermodesulfobacteriota bacterium]|nr:hypothetical protein [Thermodesulfobacteriota bacterium]
MIFGNYMRCKAVLTGLVMVIILSLPSYSVADTTDINSYDNRLSTESGMIIGWDTAVISG